MLLCLSQQATGECQANNTNNAQFCAKCGESLRHALRLQDKGTRVGNYVIDSVIGYGTFGAVYLAERVNRPEQQVAVKETFDPQSIRSFADEFKILHTLHHVNLPQYHEVFIEGGNGYLVMEYIPGQNLEDILQSQSTGLAENQVLGYALQLCDVLQYLHSQPDPIIHRDIKPANIRLTPAGLIKLVDFGIHKQGTNATKTLHRAGTAAYAPLEQYGSGTNQRSDIYSLGATLYHLLSHQEPCSAFDRIGQATDPIRPLTGCNPPVSETVASAIATAMTVLAEQRHATALVFKQALLGTQQPKSAAVPGQSLVKVVPKAQNASPPRVAARVAVPPTAVKSSHTPPVPQEIRGLCWNGLVFSFFWALAHRLWLPALLMFVPYINFTIPFILLIKGNEWAWQKGTWQSVDEFKAKQRSWTIASMVILAFPALIILLAMMVS